MALSSVVFPQPDGPTIMQNSPGAISIEQWSTAITLTPSGSYSLVTSRMLSAPRDGGLPGPFETVYFCILP